jgi:hypothetical protein
MYIPFLRHTYDLRIILLQTLSSLLKPKILFAYLINLSNIPIEEDEGL